MIYDIWGLVSFRFFDCIAVTKLSFVAFVLFHYRCFWMKKRVIGSIVFFYSHYLLFPYFVLWSSPERVLPLSQLHLFFTLLPHFLPTKLRKVFKRAENIYNVRFIASSVHRTEHFFLKFIFSLLIIFVNDFDVSHLRDEMLLCL